MKRAVSRALLAALFSVLCLLPAGPAALGQDTVLPLREAEIHAIALLEDDKLISARTAAEEILRDDPDSIAGHYVLGVAFRDAEGSLPRALAHLREARRLFETRLAPSEVNGAMARLFRNILFNTEHCAGLMERYEEQLALLDDYDALFQPPLIGQRAWPLMKLGRYEEARNFAKAAIETDRPVQRSIGMNALCAIDAESRDRRAAWDSCRRAFVFAKERAAASKDPKHRPGIAVHAHNASLGALGMLRHDEAERLALEATERTERSASNPWMILVQLYLAEGRGGDATSAIRKMLSWCAHQAPAARDQKAAQTDIITATLLLVAGEAEQGLRFASRAIERPDRQAISSAEPEQALGGHALVRRALSIQKAELEHERASTLEGTARARAMAASLYARASVLPDRERVVSVLANEERLVASLRVYLDGGLDDLPSWLMGDLVQVLGAGVVEVALSEARAEEIMPEVAPYLDAIEAELRLAKGEFARARELAEQALERLPKAEVLMRARVAALGAEAARRAGEMQAALALFQRSLELDPGTLRRLSLAVPAMVRLGGGGEAAAQAAALLRTSPRLVEASGAFEVRVEPWGGGLRACLFAPLGASLGCAEVLPKEGEGPREFGARVAREFHRVVFALRLPITESDIRSLDGVTRMSRDLGRERLRDLLEGAKEEAEPKAGEGQGKD